MSRFIVVAAVGVALAGMAGAASAGTVMSQIGEFQPLPVAPGSTSVAIQDLATSTGPYDNNSNSATSTTFVDDYLFTISGTYDTTLSGQFYNKLSGSNISSVDLSLYEGLPNGPSTRIDTTGTQSFSSKGVYTYFLDDILSPSVTYYLQADVVVPAKDIGKYGLTAIASAVPEPSTWLMMIAGVAMIGSLCRYGRRRDGAAIAVA
jgi:hypothetical protein